MASSTGQKAKKVVGVVVNHFKKPLLIVAGTVLAVILCLGCTVFMLEGASWQLSQAAASSAACGTTGTATTTVTVGELTPEQMNNAAQIIAEAEALPIPPDQKNRAKAVGIATAMQESTLNNINYGDRDSLGLFQQRPSQGWGTPEEILDPKYASRIFFERLLEVPEWFTMPITVAAQTVQGSAFPDAYAKWEPLAHEVVGAIDKNYTVTGASPCDISLAGGGVAAQAPGDTEPQANCIDPLPLYPCKELRGNALHALYTTASNFGCQGSNQRPDCVYEVHGLGSRGGKSDHPSGRALDLMVGTNAALGDQVASYFQDNATALNITYIIWKQQIWRAGAAKTAWAPMADRGGLTANHFDHNHISFK